MDQKACCRCAMQQSIDIAQLRCPQQQTRHSSMGGRMLAQTDGHHAITQTLPHIMRAVSIVLCTTDIPALALKQQKKTRVCKRRFMLSAITHHVSTCYTDKQNTINDRKIL